MTLHVTTLPVHSMVPGKAGPWSQAGEHHTAVAHHPQPWAAHRQHSQVQTATDISHKDKKLGKSSHCQPLFPVLVAAKALSSEERVACKVEPARGSGQQLREISCRAGHCLRAQSGVPIPMGEVPHGCSAGIRGTGVTEALA